MYFLGNFEIVKCVAFVIFANRSSQIGCFILTPTPCQVFIADLNLLKFKYWRRCVRSCVFYVQSATRLEFTSLFKEYTELYEQRFITL